MSSGESVSYDGLVEKYCLSPPQLQTECVFCVQFELAKRLSEWPNVGPHLLGENWEQKREEIKDARQDEKERRLELLRRWKQTYRSEATYEKLIRSLLSAERTDLAEVVCKAIGESCN